MMEKVTRCEEMGNECFLVFGIECGGGCFLVLGVGCGGGKSRWSQEGIFGKKNGKIKL